MKRRAVRARWWDVVSPSWALVLAAVVLAPGCGSGSSAGDIAEELKTVTSWAATAHMVGDTWLAGSVPTSYTLQTLVGVRQRLQEERSRIESRSIPADTRAEVLRQLEGLEATLNQMLVVIRQGDRKALAQQIGRLSAAKESLASLGKGS